MPFRRQACGCDIPCRALHAGEPGVSVKLRPPRVPTKVPVERTCGSGSRHGSSSPARDWCDATALPIHPAHGSDRAPSFRGETSGKMRPRHARPPLAGTPRGGRRTVPSRRPSPGFRGVPSSTMKMDTCPQRQCATSLSVAASLKSFAPAARYIALASCSATRSASSRR